jgi:hypothetical protein
LKKSEIGRLLTLRSDFEDLTHGYNMPEGSDINTLEWFVENGHRSNSLRNGFDNAKQIAITILTEHKQWQKKQKPSMHQQSMEQT